MSGNRREGRNQLLIQIQNYLKNLQYYANIVKATGKPHENSPIKIQESVVLKLFLRITKN